jgi:hypothetical protein
MFMLLIELFLFPRIVVKRNVVFLYQFFGSLNNWRAAAFSLFCILFYVYFCFLVLCATSPLQSLCYLLSFLSSACAHITAARETPRIFMKFKCRILWKCCHFSIVWNCTKITGTLYGGLCLFLLASVAYLGLLIISRGGGWGRGRRRSLDCAYLSSRK